MMKQFTHCRVIDLGATQYLHAYELQKDMLAQRQRGDIIDTLLISEHCPVVTAGRAAGHREVEKAKKDLAGSGISFCAVERGGGLTYHGPGQLVAYPIINLKDCNMCIESYVGRLEDIIIDFLRLYNIVGYRRKGARGVWTDFGKIASIGIGISKWVAYHGLAININTDMKRFFMIRPCGFAPDCMTSLRQIIGRKVDFNQAKEAFCRSFQNGLKQGYQSRLYSQPLR